MKGYCSYCHEFKELVGGETGGDLCVECYEVLEEEILVHD